MAELESISELVEDLAEEVEPHLYLYRDFLFSVKQREKPLSLFSTGSFHPKIESIRIGIYKRQKPMNITLRIFFIAP